MEYYLAVKNDIVSGKWMELEKKQPELGIKRKINIVYIHLFVEISSYINDTKL